MSRYKFKRSDYESVLKEDSLYRNKHKNTPTPLFMYDDKHLVMWSGEGDVPEVGDKVDMRVPVRYTGIVKSHFMEYGYVGMRVLPFPEYHKALSEQGYGQLPKVGEKWTTEDLVYNYGVDINNDR